MAKESPKTVIPKIKDLLLIFIILLAAALFLLFLGKTREHNVAAYFLLALNAAVVTYGILGSTGKIKTKETQIRGAAAVFIVILIVFFYLTKDSRSDIRGMVYLNSVPPKKAVVYLLETELRDNRRFIEERDKGYFEFRGIPGIGDNVRFGIEIPPYKESVVSYPYKSEGIIRIFLSTDDSDLLQAVVKKPDLEIAASREQEIIFIPTGTFLMDQATKKYPG
ncbi:MAG: hypothetical protein MUF15_17410 [Acidobacteria bacterium]|jgi:hypothetical protein|nr:hypothetical protein [Acidobacteriota bacterium]